MIQFCLLAEQLKLIIRALGGLPYSRVYQLIEKISRQPESAVWLTLDEANLVLEALGEQPFNQVWRLIYQLNQQADAQLAAGPPAAEALPRSAGTPGRTLATPGAV
jgi:hypothetical protein